MLHLQNEDELLSGWWKEYAECCEGPRGPSITSKSTPKTREGLLGSPQSDNLYETDEDRVGVPVKGGLYEVSLLPSVFYYEYLICEGRILGHSYMRDFCYRYYTDQ